MILNKPPKEGFQTHSETNFQLTNDLVGDEFSLVLRGSGESHDGPGFALVKGER